MDLTLEVLTILAGLPLVLVAANVVWMAKLKRDLKIGRRARLKWKELSLLKKLYVVAMVCYLAFVLYSDVSTYVTFMTGTGAPFITELQDVVAKLWLGTVGILGVGLFYSLRSPVKRQPSEP